MCVLGLEIDFSPPSKPLLVENVLTSKLGAPLANNFHEHFIHQLSFTQDQQHEKKHTS